MEVPIAEVLLYNPNRLLDIQDEIHEMVFNWIKDILTSADAGKIERIEAASIVLQRHFGKVDLNELKQIVEKEDQMKQEPKMTKEEALDLWPL